ncbi:histone acetyltransferase MCC1 [Magnolia sinica]|uniref:histone acetyltransferase MCC1 n=1 Tax=Magnolia sinica TaxID=86752 RepID=UPI00265B5EE3|nr:histone acetyltransferase MCC1 [Magnolia sinica]
MVDSTAARCPNIVYRPIRPSDLEVLEQMHIALFPIRYESEFFRNVVNGHDIVSWAAVDSSRPDSQCDELIGFVTARIIAAKESEIGDMLGYDSSRTDQTLVYVLTLGVVEAYRNLGIASSLIREVIKYAASMPVCRAVYLHVISYNDPAIHFYKKMQFKCLRRLSNFYYIKGRHYDSFLFVYYVNGGRSTCSPLDLMAALATYVRSLFSSLAAKLWKKEEKNAARWSKCKETSSLLITQNKRIHTAENAACQCV